MRARRCGRVFFAIFGLLARGEALFFQFEGLFFQIVSFGSALFGGLLAFLRFEANLLLDPLGSYSSELFEGLVEGAFVGGLVAQVESELLGGEDVLVFDDARCLQAQSAGAEPFVVGQGFSFYKESIVTKRVFDVCLNQMARTGANIRIPLKTDEALAALLRVKPTKEMPRPGASKATATSGKVPTAKR